MRLEKTIMYLVLLALLVLAMIAINEWGYGIFALFLLFPAYWLMGKVFGKEEPGE